MILIGQFKMQGYHIYHMRTIHFLQDEDMNFTRKYIEKSIHLMRNKQDILQDLPIPSYKH